MTSLHVRPSQGPPSATRRAGLAGLALLILAACSSAPPEGTIYVHPNADVLSFERVAILPFENLTNERFASARVREVLAIELSAMGAFEVVDHGEVNRALRQREIVSTATLGPGELVDLGTSLGVQGLLLGSVLEFREQRAGNVVSPEVALSMRLIDVETGIVAWSVTNVRKGISLGTRLFGVGEKSQTEVVRELVRDLIWELYQSAGA